jgi:SNF2 family DNA or RNA helicase
VPEQLRTLQACKAVVAAHRLILSGTPVQNSIGELWGLFDWLMPGFLGSEKAFQVHTLLLRPTAGSNVINLTIGCVGSC